MRLPRVIVPGAPHHIILRGNNRRRLFSWEWEYRLFLRFLDDARLRHTCDVHALALMVNHVHLVATVPSASAASAFVHSFAQRYAQRRNFKRSGSGKLFEQRFNAFPILSERQLAIVTAYVELNPVRAGLCRDPTGSRWTTYGLHVGRPDLSSVPARLWTPSEWYLGLGDCDGMRRTRFADWVSECRARDEAPESVDLRAPEVRVRRPDGTRAA